MSCKTIALLLLASLVCLGAWAQDNPVTNGSFEQAGANGLPVDWEVLGNAKLVPEAHSGKAALLLDRLPDTKTETGINRRWAPDSGEQGAMLAELKGGLEFWYKAPQADADTKPRVYVIAMTAAPPREPTWPCCCR